MSTILEIKAGQEKNENELLAAQIALIEMGAAGDIEAIIAQAMAVTALKTAKLKLATELTAGIKIENAGRIADAESKILAGLEALLVSLDVTSLLGEPVQRIVYFAAQVESEPNKGDGHVASVKVNPLTKLATGTKGQARAPKADGEAKVGRPAYVSPDGTQRLNATDFVANYGSDEDKSVKYPHTKAKGLATRLGWSIEIAQS